MTVLIDVANLHKQYGDTVAVDDVSFAVDEAEIFGHSGRRRPVSRPSPWKTKTPAHTFQDKPPLFTRSVTTYRYKTDDKMTRTREKSMRSRQIAHGFGMPGRGQAQRFMDARVGALAGRGRRPGGPGRRPGGSGVEA
jgi:hypothetical protein